MLKKAAIVVATAAAGVLAVSPLAFAGEKADYGHGHGHGHHTAPSHSATYDHSPSCNFAPQGAENTVSQPATGVSSLVGLLGLAAPIAVPINANIQAPILSCNNLEDIGNVDVHDNFQDNSR